MSRIVSAAAAMLLVCTLCLAADQSERQFGPFRYVAIDDGVQINGLAKSATRLSIPDTIAGEQVIGIRDRAFENRKDIKAAALPNSFTTVQDWSFYLCGNMTSFRFPANLKSVGVGAFASCFSLKTLDFPESLESIAPWAFGLCSSIETVTIPDSVTSIGFDAFDSCFALKEVTLSNQLGDIADRLFYHCENLPGVEIPESVQKIGSGAFEGCLKLESIELPASVKEIGPCAFSECESLSSVTLNEGLEKIGIDAFAGCVKLETIDIPATVKEFGSRCFHDCVGLKEINVAEGSDSFKSVDGVLFTADGKTLLRYPAGNERTEYTVPDGVERIEKSAFARAVNLESVTVPASARIGKFAFYGCSENLNVNGQKVTGQAQ